MTWPKVSPESQEGPLMIDGVEHERYDPMEPEHCIAAKFDEPDCLGTVRVVAGPYSHFDQLGRKVWSYVKECDTCHEAHVEERGEHWSSIRQLNDRDGQAEPIKRKHGHHPLYDSPLVQFVVVAGSRTMQQRIYAYDATFMLQVQRILGMIQKGFERLEKDHPEWHQDIFAEMDMFAGTEGPSPTGDDNGED